MKETFFWVDTVPFWEIENGRLSLAAEHRMAAEARDEMVKSMKEKGLDPILDSFQYRLVTKMSDGRIVELVFDELGPRPVARTADTSGMYWDEANAARLRSIDSNMAYIANRASKGFAPEAERTYPKEIVYQSTMRAERLIRPEPMEFIARTFTKDELL